MYIVVKLGKTLHCNLSQQYDMLSAVLKTHGAQQSSIVNK